VTLWNVKQTQMAGVPFVAHTNSVGTVAFSPDGQFIASGANLASWERQVRRRIKQNFSEEE
jgi:hypothetical protein